MEIFAPGYYKDFKCVADKCRHSCCVGWQIDVDEATMEKYKSADKNTREKLLSNVEEDGGVARICLLGDGKCPFLDESALCRIISTLGEDFVSDICREHPRFYNRVGDRLEVGLGLVCEEACRIVLSSDGYSRFEKVGEREDGTPPAEYDAAPNRNRLLSLISDTGLTYAEKLSLISEEYNVSADIKLFSEWLDIISGLEFLDESHRGLLLNLEERTSNSYAYLERFLAYLITRYVSVGESYENLRARLGFCLLSVKLMECAAGNDADEECVFEFARIFSEEIEYSEDNVSTLIFEFECSI